MKSRSDSTDDITTSLGFQQQQQNNRSLTDRNKFYN